MKYQPSWKLLDENTLVIPYDFDKASSDYWLSSATSFNLEIPDDFESFFYKKSGENIGFIYINFIDGTGEIETDWEERRKGEQQLVMMSPRMKALEQAPFIASLLSPRLRERLKYCYETPNAHKVNLVLTKTNKWRKGSGKDYEIYNVEVKVFKSKEAKPLTLSFDSFKEVKNYGLGDSMPTAKFKNTWRQLSRDFVEIKLQMFEPNDSIFIPEQFHSFFNIIDKVDIDLSLDTHSMHNPARIELKGGQRVINYGPEFRERLINIGVNSADDKYQNKYTTITIFKSNKKTSDSYIQLPKYGKKTYGVCNVYSVRVLRKYQERAYEFGTIHYEKELAARGKLSDLNFGHIDGTTEGQVFANREELRLSGIHAPPRSGIWGREADGSVSIVLSGGYADDIDDGDYILYTGQGGQDNYSGRLIKDQEFTRGNKGLQLNKEYNLPVRVTRGHQVEKGPDEGYRYDGLYYVTDYERVKGKEGFQICRFHLQREVGGSTIEDIEHSISPAERIEYNGNRVKRNVSFAEQIKVLYDNTCQVCNVFLKTPIEGVGISEAAHIKAIGKPHNGDDTKANMLCLCPNHHAQFDRYTFYIEPETLEIVGLEEYKGKFISLNKKHKVNVDYFEYQKQQYLQNN